MNNKECLSNALLMKRTYLQTYKPVVTAMHFTFTMKRK